MLNFLLAAITAVFVVSCGGGQGGVDAASPPADLSTALPIAAKAKPPALPALVAGEVMVVNSTTAGDQSLGVVGATSDGGYAVVWVSGGGSGLLSQAYDSTGAKAGGEVVLPISIAARSRVASAQALAQASLAVLADGSVVVLYRVSRDFDLGGGNTESRTGVYFQIFDRTGALLAPETPVASLPDLGPRSPFLGPAGALALSGGGFVVAWTVVRPAATFNSVSTLSLRWFDRNGQAVGSPAEVGDFPELASEMVPDLSDGFVLTIARTDNFGRREWSAQAFDANHVFVEVVIPTLKTIRVVPLDGAYVLFAADSSGVTEQLLDTQGQPLTAPVAVDAFPAVASELADGTFVTLTPAGNGAFNVGWFAADLTPLGTSFAIGSRGVVPQLASLAEPGFVAAWTGASADTGTDVYAQRFMEVLAGSVKKACLDSARQQHLTGQARKAFMETCTG